MKWCAGVGAVVVVLASAGMATAQTTALLVQEDIQLAVDSGPVANPAPHRAVVYSSEVRVPEATWLRLDFDEVRLGWGAAGGRAVLRVTSLLDGASQTHTATTIAQWQNTSAYFNGDALRIEILAPPHTAASRIRLSHAWAGPPAVGGPATICGPTDDRVPSFDDRAARALPIGCTVWLIDDTQNCMLTAGHCATGSLQTIQFNVPESDGAGNLQHPGPEDQYAVDVSSKQSVNGGVGNDWGHFGCFPNTQTGLTPGEAQGVFYTLAASPPPVSGQDIRITGYGVDSSPPNWNQIQQTHAGPYASFGGTTVQYQTDTQGGNSGSAVLDDSTGLAIGIHTHGGCDAGGGANSGTGINHPGIADAIAVPLGVCLPDPPLTFTFPDGLPALLNPAGDAIRVEVGGQNGGIPDPGTGELHYDLGAGFITVPMVEITPNVYDAVFGAIDCGSQVRYYFSALAMSGEEVTNPLFAPAMSHSALSANAIRVDFADDFELETGWTVTDLPGLTTGTWQRGVPVGGGDRGDPANDADGSGQCYVTHNIDGDFDVDNGTTILTSPVLDADPPDGVAVISYWRWYSNSFGASPFQDIFQVEVSGDGGASWTNLETVGPSGSEVSGGWFFKQFVIGDVITPTSQFRIRFLASDTDPQSVVEAGVDGVALSVLACGTQCPWDLDGNGSVSTSDLLLLLASWGPAPGNPADFDGDGFVSTTDLLALLANWGDCP